MDRHHSKIIDKIRKCMRLAESDNPNEAATALRQAQRLMELHGISESVVELSSINRVGVKTRQTQRPPKWMWSLAVLVGDVFQCRYLFSCGSAWANQKGHIVFIGKDYYPELAEYAFTVLCRSLTRAKENYLQTIGGKRKYRTRQAKIFCEAWVSGVRRNVEAFVEQMHPNTEALLKQYIDQNIGELEIQTTRSHLESLDKRGLKAAMEGYQSGKNTHLAHAVRQDEDRYYLEQTGS